MLVVVLVLENPDRFAIRLTATAQISYSDIGLLPVTESNAPRTSTTTEDDSQIPEFGLTQVKKARVRMQISGLEKVNSCFQPDIRRAPRFNIGPDSKVVELALKSPAGGRFNRYTFLHCVTNAGFRPNFCIFQERSRSSEYRLLVRSDRSPPAYWPARKNSTESFGV